MTINYLVTPNIGDSADLSFPAPPQATETERTVFLHSRGFYRLHFAEDGDPDRATLQEIQNVPGAAVRFAPRRFSEWAAETKDGRDKQSGGTR
jgi:hypothetical protein